MHLMSSRRQESSAHGWLNEQGDVELWTHEQDCSWRISFFLNNTDVRERIGSSVSRWFMTEEPAIA
jgi:hypothetical protein